MCLSPALSLSSRHPPRLRLLTVALLAVALLGACRTRGEHRPLSSEAPPPPAFAAPPEQCQSNGARFALGRQITAPLLEETRMRAGARLARTLGPGDVPPPNEPQRLLVDIEATGRIVGLRCG